MMEILIALISALLIIVLSILQKNRTRSSRTKYPPPPGPRGFQSLEACFRLIPQPLMHTFGNFPKYMVLSCLLSLDPFHCLWFHPQEWLKKFLNGMRSRLERTCSKLDSFLQELIDENLNPNRPESMNSDVIGIMLQLWQEQSTSFDLTQDHTKAMLMVINYLFKGPTPFLFGYDNLGNGLMKNPEAILKKAQPEIRGAGGNKGIVNEDDIQKLPYLKAIVKVKETFRLYPSAPLSVPRQTLANCIINGHEILSNSVVYTNVWAIGRDTKYWENPNEFLPERCLNISVDMKGKDFQLIPLGAGRRGCPGYSLVLAMVEVGLANLLYSFDWDLPFGIKKDDIDTEVLPGLTMLKKNDQLLVAKNVYAQQVSSSGI
ncbi:unnamed protein product [Coffea canephora]|uniref:Cytochrome P450 71A1-like n=1 Tax=Coffea canephora TaxID=49390 RepID=A0A068VGT2_COFCA|nr:unnamed protein product [Coffea canephora]